MSKYRLPASLRLLPRACVDHGDRRQRYTHEVSVDISACRNIAEKNNLICQYCRELSAAKVLFINAVDFRMRLQ